LSPPSATPIWNISCRRLELSSAWPARRRGLLPLHVLPVEADEIHGIQHQRRSRHRADCHDLARKQNKSRGHSIMTSGQVLRTR
jgi:hypothetical protein